MSGEVKRKRGRIEFIEEYLIPIEGYNHYQHHDNHGELVRCGNCAYYNEMSMECKLRVFPPDVSVLPEDFCSRPAKKEKPIDEE